MACPRPVRDTARRAAILKGLPWALRLDRGLKNVRTDTQHDPIVERQHVPPRRRVTGLETATSSLVLSLSKGWTHCLTLLRRLRHTRVANATEDDCQTLKFRQGHILILMLSAKRLLDLA